MARNRYDKITPAHRMAGKMHELMYLHRVSEDDLAGELGCCLKTLRRRFKRPESFTFKELEVCAKALKCSVSDLVVGKTTNHERTA